jgi:catechol 2,3-dioxygenase-like lactoylglutathione lyase family enzyme
MELAGFSHVALTVSDMATSRRFYSETSELRPGLDHVSLTVSDVPTLAERQSRLEERGVHCDLRRSEWGHHLDLRDPDDIALELVVLQPDGEVAQVLARAGLR